MAWVLLGNSFKTILMVKPLTKATEWSRLKSLTDMLWVLPKLMFFTQNCRVLATTKRCWYGLIEKSTVHISPELCCLSTCSGMIDITMGSALISKVWGFALIYRMFVALCFPSNEVAHMQDFNCRNLKQECTTCIKFKALTVYNHGHETKTWSVKLPLYN